MKISTLCLSIKTFSKFFHFFIALILFLFQNSPTWAGFEVGNGGDGLRCVASDDNPFEGLYSLDYVLTYKKRPGADDIVPVQSWQESRNRLSRILSDKAPYLSYWFEDFLKDSVNFDDYTRPRIWLEASFGLIDIKDENLVRALPQNCLQSSEDEFQFLQIVQRLKKDEIIHYEFDYDLYDEFSTNKPLQFSFLLVHEWLWDFADDARVIRKLNHFLHSQKANNYNRTQFYQALSNLGLDLDAILAKKLPMCDRSVAFKTALENSMNLECALLDIYDNGEFSISGDIFRNQEISFLLPWDLAGYNTKANTQLDLSNNNLEYIPWSLFFPMSIALNQLNASQNKITRVDTLLLSRALRLQTINLSSNELIEIPVDFFRFNPQLRFVRMYDNKIEKLPKNLFANGRALKEVDFSFNRLSSLPPGFFVRQSNDLTVLNLNSNQFREFDMNWVSKNTGWAPKILKLADNPLEKIIFKNKHLGTRIDLSNTKIRDFPDLDSCNRSFGSLILSGTPLVKRYTHRQIYDWCTERHCSCATE